MKPFARPRRAYYLLFLLLTLTLVSRSLLLPACLPFDANDDRNHTLVNFTAAQWSLAHGEAPLYSFFNNFGTPIAGDALTLPFALHAIPYYFAGPAQFPYVLGFSRCVMWLASLIILFHFYRGLLVRDSTAFAAALFAAATPGFLWHVAHFAYQAALPGVSLLLLLIARHGTRPWMHGPRYVLLLGAAWTLLMLGCSPNIVAIAIPFVLAAAVLLPGTEVRARVASTSIGLAMGAVLSLPDTYPFVIAVTESARADVHYFAGLAFTSREYWPAALLGWVSQRGHHTDISVHVGIVPLLLAVCAVILDLRRSERRSAVLVAGLGLAPFVVVSLLLLNQDFLDHISLLRTWDITRVYWVSGIFLALGVGRLLDRLSEFYATTSLVSLSAIVLCGVIVGAAYDIVWWQGGGLARWSAIAAMAPAAVMCLLPGSARRQPTARALIGLVALMMLTISLERLNSWRMREGCGLNHYYSQRSDLIPASFELFARMQPQARVAGLGPSEEGIDLAGVLYGVLGSGGRAIVAHGGLQDYLTAADLVERDNPLVGYHFRPPRSLPESLDTFRHLGIRYLVSNGRLPQATGMSLLTESTTGEALYEIDGRPTPVYLQRQGDMGDVFLRDYDIRGRSIEIALGQVDERAVLVAAFVARRGISARVDGRARPIVVCADQLIRLPLGSGDSRVQIEYWPYRSIRTLDAAFDRRDARDALCR